MIELTYIDYGRQLKLLSRDSWDCKKEIDELEAFLKNREPIISDEYKKHVVTEIKRVEQEMLKNEEVVDIIVRLLKEKTLR